MVQACLPGPTGLVTVPEGFYGFCPIGSWSTKWTGFPDPVPGGPEFLCAGPEVNDGIQPFSDGLSCSGVRVSVQGHQMLDQR